MPHLKQKKVLITGGTTGLGFELMRQLLKEECRLAICARNTIDLKNIKENFPEVEIFVCDVGQKDEVEKLMMDVNLVLRGIDIIINNAGIIMVAPMEGFSQEDYEHAMSVMYWGIVHTTFAALPYLKKNNGGQIINITSVGGKVSIPYLLPYSSAKFAAVGFSEGIAAELRKYHIYETTIVPGLMRTGSYINALFQKNDKSMYKIFSAISSAPLLTISAQTAARRTIRAIKSKKVIKVLGVQAKMLIGLHHFFPSLVNRLFSLTANHLPGKDYTQPLSKGKELSDTFEDTDSIPFANLGRKAQQDYQEQHRH